MSVEISEKYAERIEKAEFTWFTTVRADGMPQPTPVWFVRDGDTFVIYTTPGSQKVKNIEGNPHVALGWIGSEDGGDYTVIQGTAKLNDGTPPANQMPVYFDKYKQGITEIEMTPESFIEMFSVPIRITPLHVRGE